MVEIGMGGDVGRLAALFAVGRLRQGNKLMIRNHSTLRIQRKDTLKLKA